MVALFGGTLPGQLGVLGLERWQLELLEMMLGQHLRRVIHIAGPDIILI
ncbi:hypothetical protein [Falsiphaeobacter marinintestinus]|nr:hypothetical protein [Phaeobacter marinintestinus]